MNVCDCFKLTSNKNCFPLQGCLYIGTISPVKSAITMVPDEEYKP